MAARLQRMRGLFLEALLVRMEKEGWKDELKEEEQPTPD